MLAASTIKEMVGKASESSQENVNKPKTRLRASWGVCDSEIERRVTLTTLQLWQHDIWEASLGNHRPWKTLAEPADTPPSLVELALGRPMSKQARETRSEDREEGWKGPPSNQNTKPRSHTY